MLSKEAIFITESQIKGNEERLGLLGKFRELVTDFMAAEFVVHAIDAEATKDEIIETIQVVIAMSGTTCVTEL